VGDTCTPKAPSPAGEVCDGLDNTCNGLTDAADPGFVRPLCEKQDGVCLGAQKPASLCGGAAGWADCPGAFYASYAFPHFSTVDYCDGRDNDCDAGVDEDLVPSDSTCGLGAC